MNRNINHSHHHGPPDYNRAFAIGVTLNVGFVVVEVVFGLLADSLALLTDAGHNLSDVLGLLLAWGASALASRRPSIRRTYGYSRATILASLASGLLLLAAVGAIAWEAVQRFMQPALPAGETIMLVAGIGVVINTATALLFLKGRERDLNIRGAFLHMAADAAVSLGVVISGAVIWRYGLVWVDPVISLVIAGVIFISTWDLMRDSVNLAIDAVPRNVDPEAVREFLQGQPGVTDLHDLHIWAMSTTDTALTAHLVMPDGVPSDAFLHDLAATLKERYFVDHATFQVERGGDEATCHQSLHCAD
ncbi:MAG: cation diffusion facilitator family transporter [Xanthomonadales bacterium]|nr:cation diffusion facilitator family transporter [Xanthomonadales bacterium]NIN58808.1 cation diffusion facilitator family transporter [Xanthomonadales bacterium]NIN74076.1 cation diffusion facilitator family transporter [Xanthomonadales bacterium]NIO14609.1 cation diffusion facilitator family transporter [Xanthomonadales bacterium]NIP11201.1 cation diffusion facilitator family transporter [Xanthomonadales bacterium]